MAAAQWLVEIRLNDWEPDLPSKTRLVAFEEVLAQDEYTARHAGFSQFAARCKYEPILKRKMQAWGITANSCCAPAAVQL